MMFSVTVLAFYWFYNGQLSCFDPDLSIGVIMAVGFISLLSATLSYLHCKPVAKPVAKPEDSQSVAFVKASVL